MKIGLYTLTSPLHDEASVNAASAAFISEIEKASGLSFDFRGSDFSDYGSRDLDLVFVRTGGTEGLFKEALDCFGRHVNILTSGRNNSLAASMEILSFLNQNDYTGEIIHGSTEYVAGRIAVLAKVAQARRELDGVRLGVIGQPSDWLISSAADRPAIGEKSGITLMDIPIADLVSEYENADAEQVTGLALEVRERFMATASAGLHKYAEGAFRIYVALKNIIARHRLSGLTLRCFDLLDSIGNTGCLALALLNAERIPAGCEGDVPALVTMTIGNALTGVSGFQANPSRIDPQTGEILFAHCTVPFDMVDSYSFNTHFESGIGIAVAGNIPAGGVTVFKVSGDMSRIFCAEAELVRCQTEGGLCRTQALLRLDDRSYCSEYFLKKPIGNHHIVFPGRHSDLFQAFFQ